MKNYLKPTTKVLTQYAEPIMAVSGGDGLKIDTGDMQIIDGGTQGDMWNNAF